MPYISNLSKRIKLMIKQNIKNFLTDVLKKMPTDWLELTTHRLDIYNEKLAKTEFLEHFENLYQNNISTKKGLHQLPTAYDYVRLGHPLSSVLEWAIAKENNLKSENVVSFSSSTMAIHAVLRKNLFENKNTQIYFTEELPSNFDIETIKKVYGYKFDVKKVESINEISRQNNESIIFISQEHDLASYNNFAKINFKSKIDFLVNIYANLGGIVLVSGEENENYISEIQHVRRRETIAMTPVDCYKALQLFVEQLPISSKKNEVLENKTIVLHSIKEITGTNSEALLGSCGLSVQYAIMMGLIDCALDNHQGKDIKIIVPPNCYGGTNDQARRVAASIKNVEIVDLPVDGKHNMVQSIDNVLNKVANEGAIPLIIAEIPTNPRVEVPDLKKLTAVLSKNRKTPAGENAIAPIFILDQTFCPNVHFLGEKDILSSVKTISYVSGSKFPSGGKCTAGYCVANKKAENLMPKISKHLNLCDNQATDFQIKILSQQLPSMNQRIYDAYKNTREFVHFIETTLPSAKINFVSEKLAKEGFTPSVFSLDLPTKGNTPQEKEMYKRALNKKLINLMIQKIPNQSKHCVSYGQLKGSYWTIPATSTQGTTKEGDKDYIVRISMSPNMNIILHKKVFAEFVEQTFKQNNPISFF